MRVLLAQRCEKGVEALRRLKYLYIVLPWICKENLDALTNEKLALMCEFHGEFHGKEEKTEA